ncbi:MAG: nitroreductase family protein [FCB group bacterium]|nr:nitroreductase family protein [FCB group bacterium]
MRDKEFPFRSYQHTGRSDQEIRERSGNFYESMKRRRSIRQFSDRPIPKEILETLIMTAASAPSGANKQPWFFAIVRNPDLKRKIRIAAEEEERAFYSDRAPQSWIEDLEPLGTDWHKPYLEIAPALIVVFKQIQDISGSEPRKNYYVTESVGIACGFLFAAIQQAGLVALPHTPSPMNFLSELLHRPSNEKPILLVPVGHPAEDAQVPVLSKKPFEDIAQFF